MTHTVPFKILVRWRTRRESDIARIRGRFGFPAYTTLNGFTPGWLHERDRELLDECERRGFLSWQPREWEMAGDAYTW